MSVVKIGDTVSEIQEGLNAGTWTIGILKTGNEVGMHADEIEHADPSAYQALAQRAALKLKAAGAHFIADEVAEVGGVIQEIGARLARGETPGVRFEYNVELPTVRQAHFQIHYDTNRRRKAQCRLSFFASHTMLQSFISGALAGYAIAIPVGAIAILIIETGLQRGFWHAFAAGAGTATADLIYATIAATLGVLVAQLLAPIETILKIISAAFLVGLGLLGLYRAWQARQKTPGGEGKAINASVFQTYVTLVGLTLLNPATIAYFAALILGGTVGAAPALGDKAAFVGGAALASLSWQSIIAALGALAHKHLPAGFREWTGLVGNVIIIILGLRILF